MSELQFDRAEFDQPGTAGPCAGCRTPIAGTFFRVNGQSVCPSCLDQVRAARDRSSPGQRFIAASAWGLGAAIVGAALAYGVFVATDATWGIVGIAVGFLVGYGVRRGAQHRGGAGYQALAMSLTYIAIALSYAPLVFRGIDQAGGAMKVVAVILGVGYTLAMPILVGVKGGIISLFITGIAIYQAWKLNKRPPFLVTGPHTVAVTEAPPVGS